MAWLALALLGGLLMDRYDNRVLISAGVLVLGTATVAGALSTSYSVFLVTPVIAGVGNVLIWTTGANLVSRLFAK